MIRQYRGMVVALVCLFATSTMTVCIAWLVVTFVGVKS